MSSFWVKSNYVLLDVIDFEAKTVMFALLLSESESYCLGVYCLINTQTRCTRLRTREYVPGRQKVSQKSTNILLKRTGHDIFQSVKRVLIIAPDLSRRYPAI